MKASQDFRFKNTALGGKVYGSDRRKPRWGDCLRRKEKIGSTNVRRWKESATQERLYEVITPYGHDFNLSIYASPGKYGHRSKKPIAFLRVFLQGTEHYWGKQDLNMELWRSRTLEQLQHEVVLFENQDEKTASMIRNVKRNKKKIHWAMQRKWESPKLVRVGLTKTWKDRSLPFWTVIQPHKSSAFVKHPTDLDVLTKVFISGDSFVLITFESAFWRDKYLEFSAKIPISLSSWHGDESGTSSSYSIWTPILGSPHVDGYCPRHDRPNCRRHLQEHFTANRTLHPGYTATFKSRTLQKLSLWPWLLSIMMAQVFNHGFQEEGPR